MSFYFAEPPCAAGHHWQGGACSVCGERLRCGACMRFVTIEGLDKHIDSECPVAWDRLEGAVA